MSFVGPSGLALVKQDPATTATESQAPQAAQATQEWLGAGQRQEA